MDDAPKVHVTLGGVITQEEIPPPTATRSQKVAFVARLMRELRWETGETGPILARAWKTSKDVLKQIGAEAHRRVKDEVTDPDVVGRTVAAALVLVIRRGLQEEGELGTVVRAAKVWSDITGASAAIRIRIATAPVEELSDEELLEEAREAMALIKDRKGRI